MLPMFLLSGCDALNLGVMNPAGPIAASQWHALRRADYDRWMTRVRASALKRSAAKDASNNDPVVMLGQSTLQQTVST